MFFYFGRLILILLSIFGWFYLTSIVLGFDEFNAFNQSVENSPLAPHSLKTARKFKGDDSLDSFRKLTITKQTTWKKFSEGYRFPLSFKHFINSRLDLGLLPSGTSVILKHPFTQSKEPSLISAFLPDGSTKIFKRNHGPEYWEDLSSQGLRKKTFYYHGAVNDTLRESAISAQMDPEILFFLESIFSQKVDLNRDIRKSDEWRLSINGLICGDEVVAWDNILAAQIYINNKVFSAVRFNLPEYGPSYFDLTGRNIQQGMLSRPVRFSHVTSSFLSNRFHPILGRVKPHYGIDFGAPTGTPVLAVSGGEITFVGVDRFSGNMIKISHGPQRESRYLHLSRVGSRIAIGKKVTIGQVIGYVGNSGLTTGPHLHYEFWVDGKAINPLSRDIGLAILLPSKYRSQFKLKALELIADLPKWENHDYSDTLAIQGDSSMAL